MRRSASPKGRARKDGAGPERHLEIEYLPVAVRDVHEIFDYIRKDDPDAAGAFIERFDKAVGKLSDFPHLGVEPKDDRLRIMGYRMLVIDNYLVFYVVKEDAVEVRRVVHGKRRYSFLL
jgi:toxin ParE1/3/4